MFRMKVPKSAPKIPLSYISSFASQVLVRCLLALLWVYTKMISPWKRPSCRFVPSCSEYMINSLRYYGVRGFLLGLKRLSRCHPWGGFGFDPVPLPSQMKISQCLKGDSFECGDERI